MSDNKYNDISNSIFLAAKGLFRTMLEDGVPIANVQAVAANLHDNLNSALQMAGAQTMVKPMAPPMPFPFQFGGDMPDDGQAPPPDTNPFVDPQ